MKKYEAVFILNIRKTDDDGKSFTEEFTSLVEGFGGKMQSVFNMNRRPFTYEIKKQRAGLYIDFIFDLEEDKVIAIKDKYKLDARVLRNMIIICDRPEDSGPETIKINLE